MIGNIAREWTTSQKNGRLVTTKRSASMPPLPNQRHELFAQEIAKGKTATEAYQVAGYTPSEQNASRLTRNDKVQRRVVEIQERGAKRAEVTVESLIEEAEAARILAMAIEAPSAAIAAVREKGVLSGKRVERTASELTGKDGGPIETEDVSARELIGRRILGLAARGTTNGDTGKPH